MAMDERQQWGGYTAGDERRSSERFGYGYPSERYGYFDPYERFGHGYASDRFGYGSPYGEGYGYEGRGGFQRGEHRWRGGVLAWLGAGIRAGAGWFGNQMQQWGTWFGGRLAGGTAEIGRAVRGRGEQMASALEYQDERAASTLGARGTRQSRYRRPDERILDDVWHRISVASVDPQDVEIEVNGGVVTLSGRVSTRFEKRVIEDIADSVFGVQEVHNHLRLAPSASDTRPGSTSTDPLQGNAGASGTQRNVDSTIGQAERH
jgi:BON domain